MRTLPALLIAMGFVIAGQLFATDITETDTLPPRKTAVIVENHAGKQFDSQISVLEDLVSSQIAGNDYSILSRDVVTQALSGQPDSLDSALNDNSSALRLAQNLGADFVIVPSIMTYGVDTRTYNGNGISTTNVIHTLRISYKIIETGLGGNAIQGGTVTATKMLQQSPELSVDDSDVVNELLADAAGQLSDIILKGSAALPNIIQKYTPVNFQISCTMTDPRQSPILISAPGITSDNYIVATNQPVAVQPMDVTVELDGIAIGSAPGEFNAQPGLHKIRLSREGFDPWERTVNIYDGQTLRVALQMSDDGYAHWKDTTDFLATLDAKRKLTDAEAQRLEGIAEFFKQSHYRVDIKPNVSNYYKSLF